MTLNERQVALHSNRALCSLKAAEEAEAGETAGATAGGGGEGGGGLVSWALLPAAESWRRCLADCDGALELDPGNAKALYRKSRALRALGDHPRALAR